MDSDFRIYQVIPVWDAVEECPALRDADRMQITRILFRWVTEVGRKANAVIGSVRSRFNHQTFPALGVLYAGQYFDRTYKAAEGRAWLATADACFVPQIETTKPHEDCNTYQWLTLYHTMRYSLASGNLASFQSGAVRQWTENGRIWLADTLLPRGGWGPGLASRPGQSRPGRRRRRKQRPTVGCRRGR